MIQAKLYTFLGIIACTVFPIAAQAFVSSSDPFINQDAYALTHVYEAWHRYGTGSPDVIVAIIDNGFDANHPDLRKNVWKNTAEIPNNNIDDDKNGYIDDTQGWNFVPTDINHDGKISKKEKKGNNNPIPLTNKEIKKEPLVQSHATAVAGIIGGVGYNNTFGAGINWRVQLMNIKIVGGSGTGDLAYVPAAIRYAVDNGADVISMSIVGSGETNGDIIDAIEYAHEHDVVLVAAAGNNSYDLNETPLYPICADVDKKKTESVRSERSKYG